MTDSAEVEGHRFFEFDFSGGFDGFLRTRDRDTEMCQMFAELFVECILIARVTIAVSRSVSLYGTHLKDERVGGRFVMIDRMTVTTHTAGTQFDSQSMIRSFHS